MKYAAKILAIIFSFLIIIIVLAILFLNTEFASGLASNSINKSITGTIDWQNFHYSPFKGTITAEMISIKTADHKQIISLEKLKLQFSISRLLDREIVVNELNLHKLEMHMLKDSVGKNEFTNVFRSRNLSTDTTSSNFNYTILLKSLLISDALIEIDSNTILDDIQLVGKGSLIQNKLQDINIKITQRESQIAITGNADTLTLKGQLKSGSTQLRLQAIYDWSGNSIDAKLNGDSMLVSEILPILHLGTGEGIVSLNANVKGKLTNPTISTILTANNIQYNKFKIGALKLKGNLDGVSTLKKGKLDVSAININIGSTVISEINLDALLEDDKLLISPLQLLVNTAIAVEANGFIDIKKKDFKLNAVFDKTNLTPYLTLILNNNFSGSISGKVNAIGNLNNIKDIQANAKFSQFSVSLDTIELISAPYLEATFKNNQLNLSSFDFLLLSKGALNVTGNAAIGGALNITAEGHIPLTLIAFLNPELDSLEGDASFQLKLTGTQKNPIPKGEIKISNASIKIPLILQRAHNITGNIQLTQDSITIDSLTGQIDQESFSIKSFISLSQFKPTHIRASLKSYQLPGYTQSIDLKGFFDIKKKDFKLSATLDNTNLTPYLALMPNNHLSGSVSGNINAIGNLNRIKDIQAKAQLSDLLVSLDTLSLISAKYLEVTFENQQLDLSNINLLLLSKGALNLTGNATFGGTLNITAKGRLPLPLIAFLNPELGSLEGDASFKLQLNGTQKNPIPKGEIKLSNAAIEIPFLLQRVHNISGNIQLTPGSITIESLNGQIDAGTFNLKSLISLSEFKPTHISTSLLTNRLPIQIPEYADLVLGADLQIEADADNGHIGGSVRLIQGIYYKDVPLNPFSNLLTKKPKVVPKSVENSVPFIKNLRLDVEIISNVPFHIENNLVLMTLKPELRLSGTLLNIIVNGRATVLSGELLYQNRTYDITRGILDFNNPYRTSPTIDIEGKTTVRDWGILLAVSGVTDSLIFSLRTTPESPPLSNGEADILSLLVFGKTTTETGSGSNSLVSPEYIVGQILESQISQQVKSRTGLTNFSIETGTSSSLQDTSKASLTIGHNFSRRLSNNYKIISESGSIIQRATLEYRLMENITVKLSGDVPSALGGEVQVRFEWR